MHYYSVTKNDHTKTLLDVVNLEAIKKMSL